MASRYTRDEIIDRGLNLAHSSTLDAHDKNGGVISPNAYSVQWLQQALDMYHIRYPFSGDVTNVAMTIPIGSDVTYVTGTPTVFLPTNFMLDCIHGLIVNYGEGLRRLRRVSFQRWLDVYNPSVINPQQRAVIYAIFGEKIHIAPLTVQAANATLWYFAQPAALDANDKPKFPDENTLIEYVRIKALEWTKQYAPGTAIGFLQKEIGRLKVAGLLNEPEFTEFQIDQTVIDERNLNTVTSWMGQVGPILT
jgi:hypothetical protein